MSRKNNQLLILLLVFAAPILLSLYFLPCFKGEDHIDDNNYYYGISIRSSSTGHHHKCTMLDTTLALINLIPVCPKSWGVHRAQAPFFSRLRPSTWLEKVTGGFRGPGNSVEELWTIEVPANGSSSSSNSSSSGSSSTGTTTVTTTTISGADYRDLAPKYVAAVATVLDTCAGITKQDTSVKNQAISAADFEVCGLAGPLPAAAAAETGSGGPSLGGGGGVYRWSSWFFTQRKQWLDVVEIDLRAGATPGIVEARCHALSAGVVPASIPGAPIISACLWFIPFGDMGQNAIHLRTLRGLLEAEGMIVTRAKV